MAPPRVVHDTRTLEELVGPPPTAPGDLDGARAYVERIERRLDTEDINTIERRALYTQRAKWRVRADGLDRRWMKFGARGGRLPKKDTRVILPPEEDDDPILTMIAAKYNRKNLNRLLREGA